MQVGLDTQCRMSTVSLCSPAVVPRGQLVTHVWLVPGTRADSAASLTQTTFNHIPELAAAILADTSALTFKA